ncbi:DMT family transporter [Aestuariibacter sp. GS-14]|uniref:DMT family transporter n=1 Tax=Aestuariibacter sp. GS-14 TaxID=2590670 RepID=UPI00112A130C|nr:DMT family transporter [Aestuariibacter sp. GS-14]TPV59027.1 DMT family transporter [Aestuariibacter sp. GS-14]
MSNRALAALLLLGAIWGASFMFMRVAAPEFGIFTLVELRTLLATLVFMPFLLGQTARVMLVTYWRPMAVLGLINTGIPFVLFNYASLHLQSGVLAILNATAPMFGALIAMLWLNDRMTRAGVVGLALGFVGVVLISFEKAVGANLSVVPILAVLGATCCYGIGACLLKKALSGVKPVVIAGGSQAWASLLLFPLLLLDFPSVMPSGIAWANALALALGGTGIAYLLYFYIIATAGPARAIMVGYLVPLFGIVWGLLFLGERLSVLDFSGGGLILLGISLTSGVAQRGYRWAMAKSKR